MLRQVFRTLTMVLLLLCSGCVLVVLTLGCERPPDMPPGYIVPPPRAADVVLDTPEHAARSLFQCLRHYLDAVAADDSVGARLARDQVVWHIVAQPDVLAGFRGDPSTREAKKVQFLNTLVENWAALINYYAAGLALDRIEQLHDAERRVALRVHAHGPPAAALLVVACTLGDDEQWHVAGLEFEIPRPPPAAGTTPSSSTKPATLPAASQPSD